MKRLSIPDVASNISSCPARIGANHILQAEPPKKYDWIVLAVEGLCDLTGTIKTVTRPVQLLIKLRGW